ncbi:Heterokaryon incompatibility protein 6 OR allele [Lachnellula suecica]|uniref:Heterokaryon incompatibility protein 6 OR allele n=1 Tax=Lachnellula suecica TaxID=602035 RepID=A0A8T9CHD3_9HELO|nr:Heterokaryon incompatibility protein 6 OR allele [Lachnellula suecica]
MAETFDTLTAELPPETALPFLVHFLAQENPRLVPAELENVGHLPVLHDGPLFAIKDHIRASANGRNVVLKIFKRSFSPGTKTPCTRTEFEKLAKEIRIMAFSPLLRHENIIELQSMSFGILRGDPLEICPAMTLGKSTYGDLASFQEANSVDMATRKMLCYDIAAGLDVLHRHGVLHGDLKPQHVLISDHPERRFIAKLTGFGDSLILSDSPRLFQLGGTVPFRAPEVEEGTIEPDQVLKTDLFSFGLLLWSILLHGSILSTFDLPLDSDAQNDDMKHIVGVPYLFRFIPLLIEHEIGFLDEDDFELLQNIFKCTVRIPPKFRDLTKALQLLKPHSGRQDIDLAEQIPAQANITSVSPMFEDLQASTLYLKELPFLVATQYVEALDMVTRADPKTYPGLRSNAAWALFLCNLHGYGVEYNPFKALGALKRCQDDAFQLSTISKVLEPVLYQVLGLDDGGDESLALAASMEQLCLGMLGPWKGSSIKSSPSEHGLEADKMFVSTLCSQPDKKEGVDEKELGGGNTLLHATAFYGMLDRTVHLVEQEGYDLNAVNHRNETALFLACSAGHLPVLEYLLSRSADASIATAEGENGLHWLCAFAPEVIPDVAIKLLQNGAKIGLTSFQNVDSLEWLPVTKGMDFLADGKFPGDPLLRAIGNRDMESIYMLLSIAAMVISRLDPTTQLIVLIQRVFARPFRLACELHLADVFTLLCQRFVEIVGEIPKESLPEPLKSTIGELATKPGTIGGLFFTVTESTALLRSTISMYFQVQRICYHRKEWQKSCRQMLSILGNFGFLTSPIDTDRGPAGILEYAIRSGNEEAIRFLLKITSIRDRIKAADDKAFTPIQYAISSHQFGAFALLASEGANLDLRKNYDPAHCLSGVEASYMHVLASSRIENPAFAQLLLEHGVPATIEDNRGISALNLALKRGAFPLARILINAGASITKEGIFGLTMMGELFEPSQSNQHDDLFSTSRFLLSYEGKDGVSLFITRKELQYTVLHTAAAYYSPDKVYEQLVDSLISHYGSKEHLEAEANTPSRSKALHIAIAMQNDIVVKALLAAGASADGLDYAGKSNLEVAKNAMKRLINDRTMTEDEKTPLLDRAASIVLLLAENAGWPGELVPLQDLMTALDQAMVLIKRMTLSEHQVTFMRHLETEVLQIVSEGIKDLMGLDLESLNMVRRLIERKVRPVLRADLTFGVLANRSAVNPKGTLERVREKIPWCKTLTDARLEEFQKAAAFEWFLDLVMTDEVTGENNRLTREEWKDFAMTRDPQHYLVDPSVVRFPLSLLDWYETSIMNDVFVLGEDDFDPVRKYVTLLRERDECRKAGAPIPKFDEDFQSFHFDLLQPEKLDDMKAFSATMLNTRCRCYFDNIGYYSRFSMMRMCQRMTSIDDQTWNNRLKEARKDHANYIDGLEKWKAEAGVPGRRTSSLSILKETLLAEQEKLPKRLSLLIYPADEERNKTSQLQLPPPVVPFTAIVPVKQNSNFMYRPLDHAKGEVRLLRLMPPVESNAGSDGLVECNIENYSTTMSAVTTEYMQFLESLNDDESTPRMYHDDWQCHSGLAEEEFSSTTTADGVTPMQRKRNRFIWGDFTCLSYTWGKASDVKTILLNGTEVTIGANLEAALRALREEDEFRGGLMLWADQLCINQNDISEKEKVVGNMQEIYLTADKVTVWLGAGDESSQSTMTTIRRFVANHADVTAGDVLKVPIKYSAPLWYANNILPAIIELLDRQYWRRLWIMQEITACAPCEYIYLGPNKIHWTDLAIILRSEMNSHNPMDLTDEYTEVTLNRVRENIKQAYMLVTMAETYRNLNGLAKNNTSISLGNWASWLYLGSTAEVTDQRDRVYGLLSLLPENISSLIKPNYTQPVEATFRDLSKALLEATSSFDEILTGNILDSPGLPSWAIELRDMSGSPIRRSKASGYLSPYMAFMETRTMEMYHEYEMPEEHKPRFVFGDDSNVLTVRAILVDAVVGISGGAVRNNTAPLITIINMPWIQAPNPPQHSKSSTARKTLLQVLRSNSAADDTENGTILDIPFFEGTEPDGPMIEDFNRNGWGPILQMDSFRIFHHFRGLIADYKLFNSIPFRDFFPKTVAPCNEKLITEALSDMKAISEITFIVTEKGGLGILMRPNEGYWQVVGQCYVDGLMEGEVFDMVERGECSYEDIRLR